jgi:hypothetical protein
LVAIGLQRSNPDRPSDAAGSINEDLLLLLLEEISFWWAQSF